MNYLSLENESVFFSRVFEVCNEKYFLIFENYYSFFQTYPMCLKIYLSFLSISSKFSNPSSEIFKLNIEIFNSYKIPLSPYFQELFEFDVFRSKKVR